MFRACLFESTIQIDMATGTFLKHNPRLVLSSAGYEPCNTLIARFAVHEFQSESG